MGVDETEKALSSEVWMSAEEVSEITGVGTGSIRKHLNSLVNIWKTAITKTISINHNWRKLYKLK